MIRKTDIKVVQLILTGLKKEKECHYRKERENPLNTEGFGGSRSTDLNMSLC